MTERFRPFLEASEPRSVVEFLPDEFFLIVPILRVKAARGGMIESTIVSFIDKFMNLINQVTGSTSSTPSPSSSETVPSPNSNTSTEPIKFHLSELQIENELKRLKQAIPKLNNLDDLIDELGYPSKVSSFIRTLLAGGASESANRWLINILDEQGWKELKDAIEVIIQEGSIPHLDNVLTQDSGWNKAACALLGCPKVQISRFQQIFLSSSGLGGIVKLWSDSQERRRKQIISGHPLTSPPKEVLQVHDVLCPVKRVEMEVSDIVDIPNVLSVISANYLVKSLTVFSNSSQYVTKGSYGCIQSNYWNFRIESSCFTRKLEIRKKQL
jgi:hypothetical protein